MLNNEEGPTQCDLPGGWEYATLGNILPIKYGKALAAKNRVGSGSVPVYGSSGIVGMHDASLIPGPSLIVGRKGTVGAVYFSSGPSWPIDTAYYVTSTPDTDLRFFTFLLASLNLGSLDRSTAIPGLSRIDYEEIRVSVPPLPEQSRIVAEIEKQFTRLDASVAALRRTEANLKRYRASVLRAACSGELVDTEAELACAEDREYEPADVLLERILVERRARWESQEKRRGKYKEPASPDTSDLPALPEGWVWATVDSLIIEPLSNGRSVKTASGGFPVLRLTALQDGQINQNEFKAGAWTEQEAEPFLIREGDFFVSRGNGSIKLVGLGGIVGPVQAPVAYPDTLIRLRLHPDVALNFFAQVWNSATIRQQVESTARTTAGIHKVNQQDISMCTVPLPPLAEQHRIVAEVERRLSVTQQAETVVEASRQRAERLRQSILKRAFAGELVPQDPDDEPASVLLERIRAQREAERAAASASRKRPARRRAKATR